AAGVDVHSEQLARLQALLSDLPASPQAESDEEDGGAKDLAKEPALENSRQRRPADTAPSSSLLPETSSPSTEVPRREGREAALHEWLEGLDAGKGGLLQYFDVIRAEFDSDLRQLRAVRLIEPRSAGVVGSIDQSFWQVCGVKTMGHRMLLARGINLLPG
ncbi:unnamed protein product, partial [Polarella glacialis]